MSKPKTVSEVREDFYNEFAHLQFVKNELSGNGYKTIGSWLTKALTQRDQELIEAVEGMKKEDPGRDWSGNPDPQWWHECGEGYNQALEDVINLIKERND